MANIETAIQKIAHNFVQEVVRALVGASIEEFAQLAGKGARRSVASTSKVPTAPRGRPPKAEKVEKAVRGRKTRTRRSSEEIAKLQEKIVEHIYRTSKEYPKGISVSEIARALREDIDDITRPINQAVTSNKIRKEGIKRLTRYFPVLSSMVRGEGSSGVACGSLTYAQLAKASGAPWQERKGLPDPQGHSSSMEMRGSSGAKRIGASMGISPPGRAGS